MNKGQTAGAPHAFTLIELLTVIAIIALLAAILFPVFGRVRESRRQTQCIAQMHDVWAATKQYREDWGKYPPVLLGFAQDTGGRFITADPPPASVAAIQNLRYRPLFDRPQKYLNDRGLYVCPNSANKNDKGDVTRVVYPSNTPIYNISPTAAVFSPTYFTNMRGRLPGAAVGQPMYFYKFDSYDIGPQVDAAGRATGQYELRYSLDWTGKPLGPDDAPNQLKYPNPPEDRTVLTWCTYHVVNGGGSMVPVALLSGTVKPAPLTRWNASGPLDFNF